MFEDWLCDLESEVHNSYFLYSIEKYNENPKLRMEYTRWR